MIVFSEYALLIAGDGNVRVWKDYTLKGKQKLVTAFSSVQGHRPGVRSMNAVVDWQQQSGYLVVLHFNLVLSYMTLVLQFCRQVLIQAFSTFLFML